MNRRTLSWCYPLIAFLYAVSATSMSRGQLVVHETFADGDLRDDNPALWSPTQRCFLPPCGVRGPLEYEVADGVYWTDFSGFFLMQAVTSVNGQAVAGDNVWSVRALQQANFPEDSEGSLSLGVGLDSLVHVNVRAASDDEAQLVVGLFADEIRSPETFSVGIEQFIQMDVYPDRVVGSIWPVDDPSHVITVTKEFQVPAGRPVFFGDWNTEGVFREVVVAKERLPIGGDFDFNDELGVADLDMLYAAIKSQPADPRYNLNGEIAVDRDDLNVWVSKLKNTWLGDANLDLRFDTGDLVEVFQAGTYEDGVPNNATWTTGDWNADGEFDTGDLVAAFQDGGFEAGARPSVAAVPEPSCTMLLVLGSCVAWCGARPGRGRSRSRNLAPWL